MLLARCLLLSVCRSGGEPDAASGRRVAGASRPGQALCACSEGACSRSSQKFMWSSPNLSRKQVQASHRCRVLQVTHSRTKCATGCYFFVLGRHLSIPGCQDISMSTRTRSNDQIVAQAASIHTRVHSVCRSANCEYVNIGVNRCSTAHIAVQLMFFLAYLDVKSIQDGQKRSRPTRIMPCGTFGKVEIFTKNAARIAHVTGRHSSRPEPFLTILGAFDIYIS